MSPAGDGETWLPRPAVAEGVEPCQVWPIATRSRHRKNLIVRDTCALTKTEYTVRTAEEAVEVMSVLPVEVVSGSRQADMYMCFVQLSD